MGIIEAHAPWDIVSIDIWGPVRASAKGNRYLLTVVDGFTKFARAIALPRKEAVFIAEALRRDVFSYFGMPKRIHSDKGTEFCNEVLAELCKLYGIEKSSTTPYHPQGNSYAERIHQFYKNAVSSFIKGDQLIWDELIIDLMLV